MDSRYFIKAVALAGVYFVSAKLGLSIAIVHPSSTAVWPATGVALASFLVMGYRMWPAIFLGAFFANLTTEGDLFSSIGVATGNTLEGLVGAYLVNRFANGRHVFETSKTIFLFALLAGFLSTTISATIGVTSLSLAGYADWNAFGDIWRTWWIGDVNGAIVLAPTLILWSSKRASAILRQKQLLEAIALFILLVLLSVTVFAEILSPETYPLTVFCILPLLWLAFRFDQRIVATAVLLQSIIAIVGTLKGFGPFVLLPTNEGLLLMESFICITTITVLSLSAVARTLKGSEEKYRNLFERSLDPMWIVDAESLQFLAINQSATQFYDTGKEKVATAHDILPNDDLSILAQLLKEKDSSPRLRRSYRYQRRDGDFIDLEGTRDVIRFEGRNAYVASLQDVTERKKVEKMKEEFLNVVSHELRTPMTAIQTTLENLESGVVGPLSKEQAESIHIVTRNISRLSRMINNLLDLSRLQSSRIKPDLVKSNILSIIREVVESFKIEAKSRNLVIETTFDGSCPDLLLDPDMIEQTLSNLLANALHFAKEGVRIEVKKQGKTIQIEVADDGPGIPPDKINLLFRRFEQINRPVGGAGYKGTGLGLAICKEIVALHGGKIWAESQNGARFFFTLPIK